MAITNKEKVDGAKVRHYEHPNENHHCIYCPACDSIHVFDNRWTFNNNYDKPTFSPSMLVYKDTVHARCHSFVTDGMIKYLGDCGHAMKNKTVALPDLTDELW